MSELFEMFKKYSQNYANLLIQQQEVINQLDSRQKEIEQLRKEKKELEQKFMKEVENVS